MTLPLSYLVICAAECCTTVALHEAGHAAAARSYGANAETSLFMEAGSLSGRTDYYGSSLTEHQFRIVALAGGMATALWQRPDVTVEQLIEERWTPTRRDAEDAGDYGADDLAECLKTLRLHWGDVEAEAARLLQSLFRIASAALQS